jgi:hypothetical protein
MAKILQQTLTITLSKLVSNKEEKESSNELICRENVDVLFDAISSIVDAEDPKVVVEIANDADQAQVAD